MNSRWVSLSIVADFWGQNNVFSEHELKSPIVWENKSPCINSIDSDIPKSKRRKKNEVREKNWCHTCPQFDFHCTWHIFSIIFCCHRGRVKPVKMYYGVFSLIAHRDRNHSCASIILNRNLVTIYTDICGNSVTWGRGLKFKALEKTSPLFFTHCHHLKKFYFRIFQVKTNNL